MERVSGETPEGGKMGISVVLFLGIQYGCDDPAISIAGISE